MWPSISADDGSSCPQMGHLEAVDASWRQLLTCARMPLGEKVAKGQALQLSVPEIRSLQWKPTGGVLLLPLEEDEEAAPFSRTRSTIVSPSLASSSPAAGADMAIATDRPNSQDQCCRMAELGKRQEMAKYRQLWRPKRAEMMPKTPSFTLT